MNKIEIYTGNKCIFCDRAKEFFRSRKLFFKEYNIHTNPQYIKEMKKKTKGQYTLPQIFINNLHIGGFDSLKNLIDNKKFESIINS